MGRPVGSWVLAGGCFLGGDGVQNGMQTGFGKAAASQLPFVSPL